MRRAGLAALLLLPLVGCGAEEEPEVLTVYAAASLAAPFERIAERFEAVHPEVEVRLSTGGSADLVAQVLEGAPADVVATADTATMDRLVAEGLAADAPEVIATNTLRLVTPPDDPASVDGLEDLAGARLVVCAPQVPCGAAARRLAEAAGVVLDPASEEQSVTDVLGKVTSGEADAGLVYRTDALAAGDAVRTVEVPEAAGVVNDYPVAAVEGTGRTDLARELVDLVAGDVGRAALADAGFGTP